MTGLTAYAGLIEVAACQPGDTVFVSGAAGAVGSIAGQIARLKGAKRVIGSAGSATKVAHLLDDLGFDAAFNYKYDPVRSQLKAAAPDGIEVYFDNVGGDHLEAALDALNVHGRVAVCGMISQYNVTEPSAAPRNLAEVVKKRLTIRGFLVSDHMAPARPVHARSRRLVERRSITLPRNGGRGPGQRPGSIPVHDEGPQHGQNAGNDPEVTVGRSTTSTVRTTIPARVDRSALSDGRHAGRAMKSRGCRPAVFAERSTRAASLLGSRVSTAQHCPEVDARGNCDWFPVCRLFGGPERSTRADSAGAFAACADYSRTLEGRHARECRRRRATACRPLERC